MNQSKQRTRIIFQKQKKGQKYQIFRNSVAFQMRTSTEHVEKWNEFYGIFNGSAKEGRKRKREEQRSFILNQIENTAKSR